MLWRLGRYCRTRPLVFSWFRLEGADGQLCGYLQCCRVCPNLPRPFSPGFPRLRSMPTPAPYSKRRPKATHQGSGAERVVGAAPNKRLKLSARVD